MSSTDPTEKWRGPAINSEEAMRRLRTISAMRNFTNQSRRSIQAAWQQGKYPYKPQIDLRSDVEYWKRLAAEKEA